MQSIPTKEIIDYWFNNNNNDFWFDKSCDKYITDKYKHLVDSINIDNYKDIVTSDNIIALIIIGDQFTRNIYRDDNSTKNDCWAHQLSINLINSNDDMLYPLNYRLFILLPLRHQKKTEFLNIVLSRIKLYLSLISSPILIRFYNNTIKDYSHVTDSIKIGSTIEWDDKFNALLEKYEHNEIKCNMIIKKYMNIAVSLSGGVDSMLLLHLLKPKVAIHIEYCNRDEAFYERQFLEYYCYKNSIKLYYRTIDYMVRTDNRELFEKETRIARFNLYKYVINKENLEGVCLGHHMGDVVENVFTNMIKGRDLSDFTVMKETQTQSDVVIIRPFLNHTKTDIINSAQYYKIPYFLNSTPSWSCRGVLRDKVIPILKQQFGDFEKNIIKFTKDLSQLTQVKTDMTVLDYCVKIDANQNNIDKMLADIMHGYGYSMISHKSKNIFISWLYTPIENKRQLELSKHMFCYIHNNILYFVNYSKILQDKPNKMLLLEMLDNYLPMKLKKFY
jgi:tRNA(Ile)-lysidine synthetase-like protein